MPNDKALPGYEAPTVTAVKGRYCGSKFPHAAHAWRMIGRSDGPLFGCKGKSVAEAIRRRLATLPPIGPYKP